MINIIFVYCLDIILYVLMKKLASCSYATDSKNNNKRAGRL